MRRVIAIFVAVVLAGAGTFLLVRFVQSAEDRALEGEDLVSVLVVDAPIAAGSPAEGIADLVRVEQVQTKVAAPSAIADLEPFAGMVAAIDLLPGEQLISSRFVTPEEYAASLGAGPKVEVPADMLQVTLSLTPDRVAGGQVKPGELVAVFASFEPFPLDSVEPTGLTPSQIRIVALAALPGEESQGSIGLLTAPESTGIILHKVLVTNLQAEELPRTVTAEEREAGASDLAPTATCLSHWPWNPQRPSA